MDLQALSERYANFYAPAFSVRLGGKDLVRDLAVGVSQVEVDLALSTMGRFSFTVVHAYRPQEQSFFDGRGRDLLETLKFGAPVDVSIGYRDHERLPVLLSGMVTEIATSFPDNGVPELTVSGYDHLFPLSLGKTSRPWAGVADADVVRSLAGKHNLSADVQASTEKLPQIEQNQESDLEFLKKLAQRNHFEFYADPQKRLRFGEPRDRATGVATLAWGQGLLNFKPEANLAAQVSEVHVYGWNKDRKEVIVGKAIAGEESGRDPRRKSGGEVVRAVTGKPAILEVRQPVFDAAEAKKRATAILNDHAKRYLTGDAECIGLPMLLPDRNVALAGLGKGFSKTYYIQQTVHKADTNGYRTRLKVKEPSS